MPRMECGCKNSQPAQRCPRKCLGSTQSGDIGRVCCALRCQQHLHKSIAGFPPAQQHRLANCVLMGTDKYFRFCGPRDHAPFLLQLLSAASDSEGRGHRRAVDLACGPHSADPWAKATTSLKALSLALNTPPSRAPGPLS